MSHRLHRREFLRSTAAFVAALHAPALLRAQATPATEPRLRHVALQATKLDEMRRFYHRQLGLPVSADGGDGFELKVGGSVLRFSPAACEAQPFYHFAFNVPENQFAAAKAWLKARTPLLVDSRTSKDEVYFADWNAHAVYYRDPAGNIGELIARHTLKNGAAGDFNEGNLLCISEIGVVSDDSGKLATELAGFLKWPKTGGELAFIGDGQGYFIAAPTGRPWLPDRIQKAARAVVHARVNQPLDQARQFNQSELHLTRTK